LDDYLIHKKLTDEIWLRSGCATYPEEAKKEGEISYAKDLIKATVPGINEKIYKAIEEFMAKKILLIEDEPEQRILLEIRLKASGYEFIAEADGEGGLKRVDEERPDLILVDIAMPKINGYEVCKRLKANQDTRDIPIIVMTASIGRELERKYLDLGAEEVIRKPYDSKELVAKINALLKE